MRIYKPAGTVETLERLLAEPGIREAIVEHRVLPERAAQTAPCPAVARQAPGPRSPLARHRDALHAPGGGARRAARRRGHRGRHAHRVGQIAVLRPARAAGRGRRSGRARALPLPHQGAQPGPARLVPRAGRRPPRSTLPRASTTATRRFRSARTSDQPARWLSPTRTCSTARSCPITPSGSSSSSSCATSSSTRRTRTAASSAATSPT